MQDDLIELRYFIQQHYQDVVEIPGMQRAEQYQTNWQTIETQSQTLRDKIKQIEFQILPMIQSQVSCVTNSPRRRGGLSKVASVQSIRKQKDQGHPSADPETRAKQTQLENLRHALELNEEALREEQYIDDKHREFLFQEKQRYDEIMMNINNRIAYCNQQI